MLFFLFICVRSLFQRFGFSVFLFGIFHFIHKSISQLFALETVLDETAMLSASYIHTLCLLRIPRLMPSASASLLCFDSVFRSCLCSCSSAILVRILHSAQTAALSTGKLRSAKRFRMHCSTGPKPCFAELNCHHTSTQAPLLSSADCQTSTCKAQLTKPP